MVREGLQVGLQRSSSYPSPAFLLRLCAARVVASRSGDERATSGVGFPAVNLGMLPSLLGMSTVYLRRAVLAVRRDVADVSALCATGAALALLAECAKSECPRRVPQ